MDRIKIAEELLEVARLLTSGGLMDPDMEMAFEFVFRDYAKKYNKWMPIAFKGKPQPKLMPILKRVTKKFNNYGTPSSQFTVNELRDGYVKYRTDECRGRGKGKEDCLRYYGINTL